MWFVVALMTLASVFGPGFERGRPERRTPEAPSFSGASALQRRHSDHRGLRPDPHPDRLIAPLPRSDAAARERLLHLHRLLL